MDFPKSMSKQKAATSAQEKVSIYLAPEAPSNPSIHHTRHENAASIDETIPVEIKT